MEVDLEEYDFAGWATRNDLQCSDGRTIRRGAFKDSNGKTVPMVWSHRHDDVKQVLGHALLEDRKDGVYAYCKLNNTENGLAAKEIIKNGDVVALSIYANNLKQNGLDVVHGLIREVSLVLAGANPGAHIDSVMAHKDGSDEEAYIYNPDEDIRLFHSDEKSEEPGINEEAEEEMAHSDTGKSGCDSDSSNEKNEKPDEKSGKTLGDVYKTLNDEQQQMVENMIGIAVSQKESGNDDEVDKEESEGGKEMKHNVFDTEENTAVLSHADQTKILDMAKSNNVGSLQAAISMYAEQNETLAHGIDEIETLFPDYKDVTPGAPEFIERDQGWVSDVMAGVRKSPISRIRTRQADITGTDLRALGYKKGDKKVNGGNIKLLKRTTDPQTVYRKDALNRDDIIDITDFDVVEFQYYVMKQNLNEELATAIMIGDGRDDGDDYKISEEHIRPVWTDDELYTIHVDVDIEAAKKEIQGTNTDGYFGENYIYAEAVIQSALYAREKYKGSGNLAFYCTPHLLNVMLLARDMNGRRIYSSKSDLQAALNVSKIVTAEQFEGKTRTTDDNKKKKLLGLFVNLTDYQVGATKGGEITRFNQFDIDFNQEKYLIETRLSGALTRVKSAIALEEDVTATA